MEPCGTPEGWGDAGCGMVGRCGNICGDGEVRRRPLCHTAVARPRAEHTLRSLPMWTELRWRSVSRPTMLIHGDVPRIRRSMCSTTGVEAVRGIPTRIAFRTPSVPYSRETRPWTLSATSCIIGNRKHPAIPQQSSRPSAAVTNAIISRGLLPIRSFPPVCMSAHASSCSVRPCFSRTIINRSHCRCSIRLSDPGMATFTVLHPSRWPRSSGQVVM